MIEKMQALQIALNYLYDPEEAPLAEEELLRTPDECHFTLDSETFWKLDVRGHDIWTISYQPKLALDISGQEDIVHVDTITGQAWMLAEPRPSAAAMNELLPSAQNRIH